MTSMFNKEYYIIIVNLGFLCYFCVEHLLINQSVFNNFVMFMDEHSYLKQNVQFYTDEILRAFFLNCYLCGYCLRPTLRKKNFFFSPQCK